MLKLVRQRLRVMDRYALGGADGGGIFRGAPETTKAAPEPDPPTFSPDHLQDEQAARFDQRRPSGSSLL